MISKKWYDGLNKVPFNIYPTWVISNQKAHELGLMYTSTNKQKGTMIRSFRKPEFLFNWQLIEDALSE